MRGPLTGRLIQYYSFPLEKKNGKGPKHMAPLWNKQAKKWKSGSAHAQMRWGPNPGALRRTCMPSVCVCVGGGGTLIYINIYPKIKYFSESPQNIEIKRFWTPKNGLSLHMCENTKSPPASMLVHEATVCPSVSFIWACKGFIIELVWWDSENWSQDWWWFGVLMLTHK